MATEGVIIPYADARKPQEQAVDATASVWVAASAGSGKTTVLTRRVLALLAAGNAPAKLLCITFTKAAAAEMANRVAKILADWAATEPHLLERQLAEMLGVGLVPEAYVRRARGLFARVLEEPGGLKIQTLHSFCQSLLGRFPLEAGLPPDFSVLEESEAAALRREALDRLAAAPPPELRDAFAAVSALVDEEGFVGLLNQVVGERARFEQALAQAGGLHGLITETARRLGVDPDATPARLLSLVCAAPLPELGGFAAAMAEASTKTAAAQGATLLRFLKTPAEARPALWESVAGVFLTQEGEPRKKLVPVKLAGAWDETAAKLQAWVLGVEERRKAALAQQATAALLRLSAQIFADYAAAKRARAALDYDDLILKALALLRSPAGQGWVMWKLDGGVDHVLVDEAQDVNPEQWEIARLLTEEFFAGESARPQPRTLFVVGDYKQSIFGFQGAAPDKFHQMRDYFRRRAAEARLTWLEAPLDTSYRSVPAVLQAVDAVFRDPPARDGVAEPGRPWRPHNAHRAGMGGVVEVWPLAPALEDAPAEPWSPAVERAKRETGMDRCARMIARQVRRLIEDPREILSARGRRITPGDILILARRRGAFFPRMIRALKAEGVPVAGADRLMLTDQLAVQDLLALARFCLTPEDDLTLAALLKSPLIGWDDAALFALAYGRAAGEGLWDRLKQRGEDDQALSKLRGWRALADQVPPFEFFAQVLEQGGRAALLARLGEEAADAIEELLSQALDYDRGPNAGLEGFLARLEQEASEVKRDPEAAARGEVRLMTAHGAKGLQAPVVILSDLAPQSPSPPSFLAPPDQPWLVWAPGPAKDAAAVQSLREARSQRETEESRRLLYVAMTRAEDRLYVIGWRGGREPPRGNWHELISAGLRRLLGEPQARDFADQGFPGWEGPFWRWETPQEAPPKPDAAAEHGAAVVAPPDWARRPAPPEPTPSRPLSPSELGDVPPARSPLARPQRGGPARGRLIHRLLQALPDLPVARREEAARRLLARPAHRLSPDEQADIWAETARVLSHPEATPLFGPFSRAEAPVVGLVGDVAVSGRVDRLAVTDDAIWVVDYKTARPAPTRIEDVAAVHVKQMALYRALLRGIWPDRPVRCFLLWTDVPLLMELPAALLVPIAPA